MKRLPNENHHDVASHDYLGMLHKILPPQAIIHIGAGSGEGEMHLWKQWDLPHALIIDAEAARLQWANAFLTDHPGWHVVDAVVSDINGETNFYKATNPCEDGLIPAENLAAIWPNLRTVTQTLRPAIRLDTVLAEQRFREIKQSRSIWTIVDCLPVLPILQGAGDNIGHWNVLLLRVLLKPLAAVDENATLQAIESFLEPLGYRCIHVAEGNHPAIGEAIFVRDWQTVLNPQLTQLTQARDEQAKLAGERHTQIEMLTQEKTELIDKKIWLTKVRDEQTKLATEGQAQIEQLTQARDEQAKLAAERQMQVETLTKEKGELTAARDAQSKLAADRQNQLTQLTQARDEQAKLAGERHTQIEMLTQEKTELIDKKIWLTKVRDEQTKLATEGQAQIEQLTQARDEQAKLAAERQMQVETLTKEKGELTAARDAQSKLAADRQNQLTQLTQARDEQAKLAGERHTQIEMLTQEKTELIDKKIWLTKVRDEQTKLATEGQAQIEQLTQARDEQAKLAAERQMQVETLTKEKGELTAARDAQSKLAADRQNQIAQLTLACNEAKRQLAGFQTRLEQADHASTAQVNLVAEQTQLANSRKADLDVASQTIQEKDARIVQLEAAFMELENRQHLLDGELIKAEAQIDLIKDLLLREPGL